MSLKVTILGCGTSGGVPRIGNDWGACDPSNPKNRRRRCSILAQRGEGDEATAVLVDSSPDLRAQLLDVGVGWLDGVLYTHDHADHTHGIDDLRMVTFFGRRRVNVYHDAETGQKLRRRFAYCFETEPGSDYPPILKPHDICPGKPVAIEGAGGTIEVMPFEQAHGASGSLGFRFGDLAYSPDMSDLPVESLPLLEDLDVWIVDTLRYTPHPSHLNVDQALAWIERVRPKRAILTHMNIEIDYDTLKSKLPDNVEPAYDGMVLTTS